MRKLNYNSLKGLFTQEYDVIFHSMDITRGENSMLEKLFMGNSLSNFWREIPYRNCVIDWNFSSCYFPLAINIEASYFPKKRILFILLRCIYAFD